MELDESQLYAFATELRKLFGIQKTTVERRTYKPHPRYDTMDHWLKVAKTAAQLNANAIDFIEAQFRFSKATVFANTLHGPTAVKRYNQFQALCNNVLTDNLEKVNFDSMLTPGKAVINDKLAHLTQYLSATVGSTELTDPTVKAYVLANPWNFDPVAVMLACGSDPEYAEEFRTPAALTLTDSPYLIRAAREMNLSVDHIINGLPTP